MIYAPCTLLILISAQDSHPHLWCRSPDLLSARIPPPLIPNQFPLSKFLYTDPFTLPTSLNPELKFSLSPLLQSSLMLKTWPLCTGAELNLRDRVLGEIENNSFTALPGKGGHSRLVPVKTVCPNLGGSGEEFYGNGSRVGLLIRIRVCAGPVLL